jgi:hypothetical protein
VVNTKRAGRESRPQLKVQTNNKGVTVNNRQFVTIIIMLFLTVFVANFASDTLKMFVGSEKTYTVDGIVTHASNDMVSIVDMNGEAWVVEDDTLEKCDAVKLTISNNGTRGISDDIIVSVD